MINEANFRRNGIVGQPQIVHNLAMINSMTNPVTSEPSLEIEN